MIRKIVEIDEARCDGCGRCITSCAEGAIALVDGKARLVGDVLCDGLGACLGECPQGALRVVERQAPAFDEAAVQGHLARARPPASAGAPAAEHGHGPAAGCPGTRSRTLPRKSLTVVADAPSAGPGSSSGPRGLRAPAGAAQSQLGQWPVQLHLVPAAAPYFQGADLLVAADCVPFACARFHDDLLAGKALVVGCPKLDDVRAYAEKLGQIFTRSDIRSVTVARMEVPCCGGIAMAVRQGLAASGKAIPVRDVIVNVDGTLRG
jgi:Pyruvate/2-oxoacid:ferredoxin oxidoreductase delta subunit